MDLFILLNCNHEGTNYRGIFDTLEAAIADAERQNAAGFAQMMLWVELDGPCPAFKSVQDAYNHFNWWDAVNVIQKVKLNDSSSSEKVWTLPDNLVAP